MQGVPNPILVHEFATEGDLRTFLKERQKLPFSTRAKLCSDVGEGLRALHSCNIAHNDIKLDNILIFKVKDPGSFDSFTYVAKVADFGHAIMVPDNPKSITGTAIYAAPETSYGRKLGGEEFFQADCYSFGILMWIFFLGCDPLRSFWMGNPAVPRVEDDQQDPDPDDVNNNRVLYHLYGKNFEKYLDVSDLENRGYAIWNCKQSGGLVSVVTETLRLSVSRDMESDMNTELVEEIIELAIALDPKKRELKKVLTMLTR